MSAKEQHFSYSITEIIILISIVPIGYLLFSTASLSFDLESEVQNLNNSRKAVKNVLFFNRVPKVGSQTIMNLLAVLGERNHFQHYVDNPQMKKDLGERTNLEPTSQRMYARMFVDNFTEPSVYNKHTSFIDMKQLGNQFIQPIYINFVREPVSRIISWYYYVRAPWYMFSVGNDGQYDGKPTIHCHNHTPMTFWVLLDSVFL